MHLNTKNLKFKIVFCSTLCVGLIGIVSNIYLYTYMTNIISQKAQDIDTLYLDSIQKQLDSKFEEIINLGILCSSSYEVSSAMKHHSLETFLAKRDVFNAQTILNDYLYSSGMNSYINQFFVFNEDNLSVHASANFNGAIEDIPNLLASDFYKNYRNGDMPFRTVMPSVTPHKGNCLVCIFPISNYIFTAGSGYLYVEVNPSIITDVLEPYSALNPIFAVSDSGEPIFSKSVPSALVENTDFELMKSGQFFLIDDRQYRVDIRPLSQIGVSIYSLTDISTISMDNRHRSYAFAVAAGSILLTSLGLTLIITNYITKPLQKLIARIKKISENDFSVVPNSEGNPQEIEEVFNVVNEMSQSIDRLIKDNAAQNEEKKNIEIDLLQSQINPHFLYNTLDSIHWMAVIQKNPGICNITKSLSNLLKNMSKGFSQKITLEEELCLLNDYITIQSIRYLETFELVNHVNPYFFHYYIVKMTLQPLVENAIFHGIEPSGIYGTITLDAWEENEYLIITVSDTGVGMTPDELEHVMDITPNSTRHSMNGIGVGNVNKRLQLIYGPPCGLSIESHKDIGTCITIRIRKEENIL